MTFPQPEFSKSLVKKAGAVLIDLKSTKEQRDNALIILTNWRTCHGYPLNTFQATLRTRIKKLNFQNAFVAQRLKRMPTIIKKLERFKTMKLSTMQDIGGLRAILSSISNVHELEGSYLSDKRFPHELVRSDDYIRKPKDDGYRGIHLVYKYKNKLAPAYNDLQIELQIRTKLQHIWATAVETMGTYLGQSLKSGEGETKWRDFFALASSAFAYIEKTSPVPKYEQLGKEETVKALVHIAKDIDAINVMSGFRFALNIIPEKTGKSSYYHLITLDTKNKQVDIKSYAKKDIKKASKDYTEAEKDADITKVEPVLVSAGHLRQLKAAYPNFFLDVGDFITKITSIINTSRKIS